MHIHQLETRDGARTLAVILEAGEEVVTSLETLAARDEWGACHITAIGAVADATLAFFDWERREYLDIPINEQMEVLSLAGDISHKDGRPKLHAHVVLGKRDGTAHGGHLKAAHVRPTLEVIVTETSGELIRRYDPHSELDLIGPSPR